MQTLNTIELDELLNEPANEITTNDPAPANPKLLRSSKSLSKTSNLFSKIASSVKFVVRAGENETTNKKQLFRQNSRCKSIKNYAKMLNFLLANNMRVAYIGANGQMNNKALLVTKERLEFPIHLNNDDDRKVIVLYCLLANFLKLLINLLVKRPHRRYDNEVLFLQKGFRDTPFFQKMEKEMDQAAFKKIFRTLQIEVSEPGQKLFNFGNSIILYISLKQTGDIGTKFFIIVQGSIFVLIPKDGVVPEKPKKKMILFSTPKEDELERKRDELKGFLKGAIPEEMKRQKVEECYPGFFVVKEMFQGEAFGELALQKSVDRYFLKIENI